MLVSAHTSIAQLFHHVSVKDVQEPIHLGNRFRVQNQIWWSVHFFIRDECVLSVLDLASKLDKYLKKITSQFMPVTSRCLI